MAEEHLRALLAAGFLPHRILVAGRRRPRAERLAEIYGVRATWGELDGLKEVSAPLAIVAVTETALASTAAALAERGARHLLVEKPGALGSRELRPLAEMDATVFVAYNRRFFASTQRARELIADDGGPLSFSFDFTEVESRVLEDAKRRELPTSILSRWGIANSLHVIDLAFHLGGSPIELDARRSGSLDWHHAGATFAGSGMSESEALFAYSATWGGAGRWSVEVTTAARKLVLRPLEALQQQLRGSFELEPVALSDDDGDIKPGLRAQLNAFLTAARLGIVDPSLCTLDEAIARLEIATRILGYQAR
jgi:predicted dehydrogenase